ncbi:ATP-binding protein [Nocardioides sambongensis]|uniref:ATP-binding protein n=1 Tax=Nocardioides sambongensis TaxID=2589074 RepID=UPI00112EE258|nr:ATP-binding protein [Nocardioides sambongensis]
MEADPIELLPDGAVVAGADGRVLACNAVARRMLGIAPDAAAVGRSLPDVLALVDQDGRTWSEVNRPFAGLGARTGIPEQPWWLPDGTEVLVAARIHRADRHQPPERVAVSLRSGRGRARLDRERSDLVATVAHELRSPLTGLKGFVGALLHRWDELDDPQRQLMLTTVSADADRLSRLITELLDVARIDTGRLQLHRRPTDVVRLAERVVDSVQVSTARRIELAAQGRPILDADPDKVLQVLTNLVENGVRHGEGAVRVTVSPADGHSALIVVTDEGEGIPAELRARAFTKFWTGGGGGGSGLGLYIVNGLARAHGGSVAIADAPAGGAEVRVTWPLVSADSGSPAG